MTKPKHSLLDFIGHNPYGDETEPPFKEGERAKHRYGVCYKAPWEREGDGFSEHSRRCALALSQTDVPVHLRGFALHDLYGAYVPEEIRPLLSTSITQYSVEVIQTIVQESTLQNLLQAGGAAAYGVYLSEDQLRAINTFKVLYSVWEKDRITPDTARLLNRFGQIWTACTRNRDMLIRCGVDADRLRVIPIPFFPKDPLLEVAKRKATMGRKPGPPRFYHVGKWEPRKAQDKIIRAFMLAFEPGEAHLFMKVSRLRERVDEYPVWVDEAIAMALRDEAVQKKGWNEKSWKTSIQFTDAFLSQEKLLKVHDYGDVYVTLSRGEGFDMPAYDAKLAGNRMVYTPSGGPSDFADKRDMLVKESGTVPCSSFYGWDKDACYLDFNELDAMVALRFAFDKVRQHDQEILPVAEHFSAAHVGREMQVALLDLVLKHGGKLV